MAAQKKGPIVISLDGNIGAGKSTLLTKMREALSEDVHFVDEPVGEWMTMKNEAGKSLLELFYEDKRRWGYTFQNAAILTRLKAITAAMQTDKRVVVTERSVLTDRFVFAEMLKDQGLIDGLEWQLYMSWFDAFAAHLPIRGIILVTTGVATSHARIALRARSGETGIPEAYLADLHAQHEKWVASTHLPVLRLSTEPGEDLGACVERVKAFVEGVLAAEGAPPPTAKGAAAAPAAPAGSSPVKATRE